MTDMLDAELSTLKDVKYDDGGKYVCGTQVGPACLATMSDAIVRMRFAGGTQADLDAAAKLMGEWVAAQK